MHPGEPTVIEELLWADGSNKELKRRGAVEFLVVVYCLQGRREPAAFRPARAVCSLVSALCV